ncbi:hypothetical protein NDN08_006954 [Rhodosorus marinus]|uniref:Transcription initiation factor TFIID component TAF4 C-terminal domain-containing protein n=1 Tax=Rhodosorus marinus TaxID=101924 RepID=A0AAV8UM94_9RHOD|nr:hypothetical protein NDN08_006954 [Rhodosorus marinus]
MADGQEKSETLEELRALIPGTKFGNDASTNRTTPAATRRPASQKMQPEMRSAAGLHQQAFPAQGMGTGPPAIAHQTGAPNNNPSNGTEKELMALIDSTKKREPSSGASRNVDELKQLIGNTKARAASAPGYSAPTATRAPATSPQSGRRTQAEGAGSTAGELWSLIGDNKPKKESTSSTLAELNALVSSTSASAAKTGTRPSNYKKPPTPTAQPVTPHSAPVQPRSATAQPRSATAQPRNAASKPVKRVRKWTKNCEELLTRIRNLNAAPRTSVQTAASGPTTVAKPALGRPRQPSKAELRSFRMRSGNVDELRRRLGLPPMKWDVSPQVQSATRRPPQGSLEAFLHSVVYKYKQRIMSSTRDDKETTIRAFQTQVQQLFKEYRTGRMPSDKVVEVVCGKGREIGMPEIDTMRQKWYANAKERAAMAGGAVGKAKGTEAAKPAETPAASDSVSAGAANVPEGKPAKGRGSIGCKKAPAQEPRQANGKVGEGTPKRTTKKPGVANVPGAKATTGKATATKATAAKATAAKTAAKATAAKTAAKATAAKATAAKATAAKATAAKVTAAKAVAGKPITSKATAAKATAAAKAAAAKSAKATASKSTPKNTPSKATAAKSSTPKPNRGSAKLSAGEAKSAEKTPATPVESEDPALVEEDPQSWVVSKKKLSRVISKVVDENGIALKEDALECMEQAVRERLKYVVAKLMLTSKQRTESRKRDFLISESGVAVAQQLQAARMNEERKLDVAAENRKRRRMEEEAKKSGKEGEGEPGKGGSAKPDGTEGSSTKKSAVDKNVVEREKRAESMKATNKALRNLTAGIRVKRKFALPSKKSGGDRKPLDTSSLLKPGAGAKTAPAKALPTKSGPSRAAPGASPTGKSAPLKTGTGTTGKKVAKSEKSSGSGTTSTAGASGAAKSKPVPSIPLTLRDCLYFLEHERLSRKTDLLLRWYSRLDCPSRKAPPPAGKVAADMKELPPAPKKAAA